MIEVNYMDRLDVCFKSGLIYIFSFFFGLVISCFLLNDVIGSILVVGLFINYGVSKYRFFQYISYPIFPMVLKIQQNARSFIGKTTSFKVLKYLPLMLGVFTLYISIYNSNSYAVSIISVMTV